MNKWISRSVLIVLLVISACKNNQKSAEVPLPETVVIDQAAIARLDSTLLNYVESGKIAGASALIFEKGQEVYFNAVGFADKENKIPMERNTIVQIYSMTKPLTGTALMTLYEEDKFELDDPVSKYASEFKDMMVYTGQTEGGEPLLEQPRRPMTIRDLTRHTAGFAPNSSVAGLGEIVARADALNRENTLVQMAEKMGATPLYFHPGEKWEYGPSVDVQAFMVERISGIAFKDYLRNKVLDPLGMKETRYFVPEEDRGRFSAMYFREEDGTLRQLKAENSKLNYLQKWPLTRGGSGLTSTLDDYMKFARMLLNKGTLDQATILNPETVTLMATNQLADSVEERSFLPSKGQVGFGIDFAVRINPPLNAKENNGTVGEFFWDGAASTLFWIDPVNEMAAVLFVQLFPYDRVKLHKNFRDAVYGPIEE